MELYASFNYTRYIPSIPSVPFSGSLHLAAHRATSLLSIRAQFRWSWILGNIRVSSEIWNIESFTEGGGRYHKYRTNLEMLFHYILITSSIINASRARSPNDRIRRINASFFVIDDCCESKLRRKFIQIIEIKVAFILSEFCQNYWIRKLPENSSATKKVCFQNIIIRYIFLFLLEWASINIYVRQIKVDLRNLRVRYRLRAYEESDHTRSGGDRVGSPMIATAFVDRNRGDQRRIDARTCN